MPAPTLAQLQLQDPSRAANRRGLARRSTWIGILVGLVLLGILIWRSDPAETWSQLQSLQPWLLVLALLANVPIVAIRSFRAQLVLRALGHRVPAGRMVLVTLVGQTLSGLTPGAAGDLVRAYFWHRDDDVPGAHGVTAVAFERIYSFLLLMAVGVGMLFVYAFGFGAIGLGVALIVVTGLFPWLLGRLPESTEQRLVELFGRIPKVGRFAARLAQVFVAARQLTRSLRFLIVVGGLTFALFVLSGAQLWLLLKGLGGHLPLWTSVGVYAISQTGGTLSTLPFSLGTMEVLMAGFLVKSGMSLARAADAALLLRAVTTVPLTLAALVAYLLLNEHRRKAEANHEMSA